MKNAFYSCLFISALLTCSVLSAQKKGPALIDSLVSELKTAKDDTNKVNDLTGLAWELSYTNPDTAVLLSNEALSLSKKINWGIGIADSYLNLSNAENRLGKNDIALNSGSTALHVYDSLLSIPGVFSKSHMLKQKAKTYDNQGGIYFVQANYPKSLENHLAAFKIFEQINDKKGIAYASNNLASVYIVQGNYTEALKNYFTSLKIKEEIGDKKGIANSYGNLGYVYAIQGDFPNALKYYNSSLNLSLEINDKQHASYAYEGLGNVYFFQNNYAEALKTFTLLLKLYEENNDKNGMAGCYVDLGNVYTRQDKQDEALKYYQMALKLKEEIGDKNGIAGCYNNIGTIYTQTNKLTEAAEYFNKALVISKQINNIDNIKNCYQNLAYLDSAKGNFKQSLAEYKLYIQTRDVIVNDENTKKTTEAQLNYEFEKKEAATKAQQEKKDAIALVEIKRERIIRNSTFAGLAGVLVFSILVLKQRNKIKKEKKRSDDLLLNILPAETAEELKNTGTTKAKDYDDVTVLFTDFKNFTAMSEQLSAQDLVNEINYCYSAFDNIITKYKIEKIKTIGDSYMCAGGLPVANKTNAEDTIRAALEIRDFMLNEKKKREATGQTFFEIRIGLHTGAVVAGIVGIKKFAYDIWGDTVNIASRMESSSEAGKVNISGSTHELVKDKFTCTYRGKIEAKNKGMVDMFFVES